MSEHGGTRRLVARRERSVDGPDLPCCSSPDGPAAHRSHITGHGIDMPSILNWQWQGSAGASLSTLPTGAPT